MSSTSLVTATVTTFPASFVLRPLSVTTVLSSERVIEGLRLCPSMKNVKVFVFTVEGSRDSLNTRATVLFKDTSSVPSGGSTATTRGRVVSASPAAVVKRTLTPIAAFPARSRTREFTVRR